VPTEFQNFWTIIKRVIAKMVSVGPACIVIKSRDFRMFAEPFSANVVQLISSEKR
jgi:hypothetical protein